jgi:hypothetical protein
MEDKDDIVELSVSELVDALAEALKAVTRKRTIKKGDRVKLSGVVTGIDKQSVNIVDDYGRALTFKAKHLRFDDEEQQ